MGRRVSATDLRAVVEYGMSARLLYDPSGCDEYAVPARQQWELLGEASSRPLLSEFGQRLVALPAPEPYMHRYGEWERWCCKQVARARIALHLRQPDALDSVLAETAKAQERRRGLEEPDPFLLDVLAPNCPAAAFDVLSPAAQRAFLREAIPLCFDIPLMPDPQILARAIELDWSSEAWMRSAIVMLHALGTEDVQIEVKAGQEDPSWFEAEAVLALKAGHADRARQQLRAALSASRGPSGRRKPAFSGPLAPLLTVVLATGEAEDRAAAELQLQSAQRKRASAMEHGGAQCVLTGVHPLERTELPWEIEAWQRTLTYLLACHFAGGAREEVPSRSTASAGPLREVALLLRRRLEASGLRWLKRQVDALVVALDDPGVDPAEPLVALKKVQAPWERSLERLETVLCTSTGSEPGAERGERLIFLAKVFGPDGPVLGGVKGEPPALEQVVMEQFEDDEVEPPTASKAAWILQIEPRLQKRNAKGWSKGRAVALRTLLEGMDKADYLTAEDRRVVSSITVRRDWYGERTYSFGPRMPVMLIGHPRVWVASAIDGPPLEVVVGTPTLEVREAQAGLVVQVSPDFDRHGIGLQLDAQGRLAVCQASSTQKQALDALSRLPVVPESGRRRLEAVLAPLSAHFTVQSQVGARAAPHMAVVEADPRPVVHLARSASGLMLRVTVQPLGPEGPDLPPARGLPGVSAEIAGTPTRCDRDLAVERHALTQASLTVPELSSACQGAWPVEAWEDCLELLDRIGQLGDTVRVVWPDSDPVIVLPSLDSTNLRLRFSELGDWLDVQGELVVDEALVLSLSDVLSQHRPTRFVTLEDGRFVGLSADLHRQLAALAKASAAAGEGGGKDGGQSALRIPPLSLGFVSPWLRELSDGQLSFNRKARERLERIEAAYKSKPQVPRALQAELRPYQVDGFRFLSRVSEFGGGAILADDMGLGKTLMTLALLARRGRGGPALVVAPVSLKRNWEAEAVRFAPNLRISRMDSGGDGVLSGLGPFDVVVCSYGVMTQQIETLERIRFSTAVFDEAQAVKNPAAQRTRAARRILADARVALTGTPVENHLGDLYSLMTLCNPGLLGSAKRFEEQFGKPIQQEHDAQAAAALRTLIGPFVLRRRKSEVLRELPERTEIVLEVIPDDAERAFSEALRRDALQRLRRGRGQSDASPVSILAEITRLRRAACHPCLVDADLGAKVGAAKLERLLSIAEDLRAEGHRALVFSQFVDFLQLVAARLTEAGFTYQYLDGSTSEANRQKAVYAFQDGEGELFLISLKAGGFGLNLTAADYVIHLDPWWNPAVEAQASDRAHRIGQTRPVTIYKLVNAGSIEERVLSLHERKRELAEELLQDAATSTRLDAKALLALIED